MSSKFPQDVIRELNRFRSNPKSIQHQCEVIRTGFSRLRAGDPFLNEIDAFIKELDTLPQLPTLKTNEVLSEAAKKELPHFRGQSGYQKYRKTLKGLVPDYYQAASPALLADDGADEPVNVLTKILLDKTDKSKDGRKILCDPKYTQVGIAHEVFEEENMVILIFATKAIEDPKLRGPINKTKKDFILNIQYHETKCIRKPKYEVVVNHRIKGDIFGGGNFAKTSEKREIYSQGGNRPKLEPRKTDKTDLRANKSQQNRVVKASYNTATAPNPRGRNQVQATAKNEKIQQTSMRRRNDGTSSKTETRTETRTTTSGLRGQPKENTRISTKTTTRTTKSKPEYSSVTEVTRRIEKTMVTQTVETTETSDRRNRGRGGRDNSSDAQRETKITITKVEEKGNSGNDNGSSIRKKYAKKKRV